MMLAPNMDYRQTAGGPQHFNHSKAVQADSL